MHKQFNSNRKIGEWFDISFDNACSFLEKQEFDFEGKTYKKPISLENFITELWRQMDEIELREKYHCEYCMCPIEDWSPMKTYQSDKCCELYSDFSDVVSEFEEIGKPFNFQELLINCETLFGSDYPDLKDFEAAVKEMVKIHIECGVMPETFDYHQIKNELQAKKLTGTEG